MQQHGAKDDSVQTTSNEPLLNPYELQPISQTFSTTHAIWKDTVNECARLMQGLHCVVPLKALLPTDECMRARGSCAFHREIF